MKWPKIAPYLTTLGGLGLFALFVATGSAAPAADAKDKAGEPDHYLKATPETVIWGYFAPDVPAVLEVDSGATVKIDTYSSVGIPEKDPESFFKEHKLEIDDNVRGLIDIMTTVKKDVGPHILTGPVHINDAQPGDLLEVRILDVQPRPPYFGVSLTFPGAGSLPDLLDAPWMKVIPLDMDANVGRFNENFDIPLAPFMGTMGVAPTKKVSSVPPGRFGGNLDLKDLTAGSSLYLPVLVPGGLFLTGDGHAAQGDGEVNLTGLEVSQAVTVQFILHKQCEQPWPLAETDEHYIVMGLDEDLDEAARIAVQRSVDMLGNFAGMSVPEAYAASSLAVDFALTQIVDGVKGVHGRIPKHLFQNTESTWGAPCKTDSSAS